MQVSQKYQICVDALKEYAINAGFNHVLLGLSGGIDSAVVALMCVDAFGADNVHGYLLPGPYSSKHSVDDAALLADNLGVQAQTVSILEPYEAFEKVLSRACGGHLSGLASENTQARCRMVCLMAISNKYHWMLVNTGNKSEAYMGYSTLYGDTAGAFAPLGGLYKTDVYALGRWRCEQAEAAGEISPIPEQVFTKPPSAELAPGQEDERSMGIDYASLDKLLIAHFEHGATAADLADDQRSAEQVQSIFDTAESYAFKRAMEPPYPSAAFYDDSE